MTVEVLQAWSTGTGRKGLPNTHRIKRGAGRLLDGPGLRGRRGVGPSGGPVGLVQRLPLLRQGPPDGGGRSGRGQRPDGLVATDLGGGDAGVAEGVLRRPRLPPVDLPAVPFDGRPVHPAVRPCLRPGDSQAVLARP